MVQGLVLGTRDTGINKTAKRWSLYPEGKTINKILTVLQNSKYYGWGGGEEEERRMGGGRSYNFR